MKSKWAKLLFRCILVLVLFQTSTLKADISFPARLELIEVEPGIFEVMFVLPVIQGKVLKATPVLPDLCEYLGSPVIEGNENFKIMRWRIACDPKLLAGQRVGIDNLAGSQIDIILQILLLDGRAYRSKLSPVNAFYSIPYPPTSFALLQTAILEGLRIPLTNFALYLLLMILVTIAIVRKNWLSTGLIFVVFQALGTYLSAQTWLQVPSYLLSTILLALALSGALILAQKRAIEIPKTLFLCTSAIIGLFFGAGRTEPELMQQLTPSEGAVYFIFVTVGVALGVTLLFLFTKELNYVLKLFLIKIKKYSFPQILGYVIGILTVGLLLRYASLLWNAPSLIPQIPVILILFTITFAVYLGLGLQSISKWGLFFMAAPMAMGMVFGFDYPFVSIAYPAVVVGIIFGWVRLRTTNKGNHWVDAVVFIGSSFFGGLYLASFVTNTMSYAVGQAIGFFIILVLLFLFVVYLVRRKAQYIIAKGIQTLNYIALFFIGFAMVLCSLYYVREYYPTMAPDLAIGLVPIPILSIILFLAAIVSWPRYREAHKAMNLKRKAPVTSFALLIGGLLTIPFTFSINNPWHAAQTPDRQEMQAIMQHTLSQTYTAFNIKDENELFLELSKTVDEGLIDDIYLDSRRRFSVGLREGSEVWVKEVNVDSIGSAMEKSPADSGLEYPAEWTVTARVKHLQHIHYRQNKYNGTITIMPEENQWKIAKITLNSEDRKVLASAAR